MALGLQFLHLVRLSIMPIVYYKIRQVQTSAPSEHEEGQGEGHAAHWSMFKISIIIIEAVSGQVARQDGRRREEEEFGLEG